MLEARSDGGLELPWWWLTGSHLSMVEEPWHMPTILHLWLGYRDARWWEGPLMFSWRFGYRLIR